MHIARELIAENHDVVLIEKDPDASKAASNELDCMVITEDGSRPEILRKAGIKSAAWFLALTGSDEVNIVASGLAAVESARIRTATRVENPFYSQLTFPQRRALGLDVVLNPSMEAADTVAKIVNEGFAEDVVPLHDGQLQLRYVEADKSRALLGKSLRELRGATDVEFLIAAVVREGKLDIPTGVYRLTSGDGIYVLGTPEGLDALLGPVAGVRSAPRNIFICGASKVSERLIRQLLAQEESREKGLAGKLKSLLQNRRRITFLDSSREASKYYAREFQKVEVVCTDITDEGILEEVHIPTADLVVCATESQTFNILTAQLCKTLGAAKSVAITLNDRYVSLDPLLEVDALVSIKNVVAARVLELIRKAQIRTIHSFYEDDVEIVELVISTSCEAAGKKLMDLALPQKVLVAYVLHLGKMLVPRGGTEMTPGDTVAFILQKSSIPDLERVFGGSLGV